MLALEPGAGMEGSMTDVERAATVGRMAIGGRWRDAADGGRLEVVDPANLETVGTVPRATVADLDDAVAAAAEGFEVWRRTPAWERSAVLRRIGDHLRQEATAIATTLTREQGKPLREATGEVAAAADQFDWYADEARRVYGRIIDGHTRTQRLQVHRTPIGAVAAFVPWNFPILLAARKIAPALAAGCSVIVKAPSEAPFAGLSVAAAAEVAGLPPGVLNVVTGQADLVAERLVGSDVIRKVTLTGSVGAARAILRLCAETAKPATMELGGNAPAIVLADADVDDAIEAAVRGKFRNAGQICIAPNSFFVAAPIYERFVDGFTNRTNELVLGHGLDSAVDVGPLVNHRRLAETVGVVADARERGGTIVTGGEPAPEAGPGHFFRPTVVADATESMRAVREEIFGPVAPIVPVDGIDDALATANRVNQGLVTYVFTRDSRAVFRAIDEVDSGMLGVNNLMIATAEAPFGGVHRAGYGRENGPEGMEGYLTSKYVNWIP